MKNLILFFVLLISISSCEKKGVITYPKTGFYGDNILSLDQKVYSNDVSLTAEMTRESHLYVTIKPLIDTASLALWSYDPFSNKFLIISDYKNNFQSFESEKDHNQVYLSMDFEPGKYLIKIFDTEDRISPRIKEIEVK